MISNRQSFGCFGGGLNRSAGPNFRWATAGPISNRFIVRLETSVTRTKQTPEHRSNRNISEGVLRFPQRSGDSEDGQFYVQEFFWIFAEIAEEQAQVGGGTG